MLLFFYKDGSALSNPRMLTFHETKSHKQTDCILRTTNTLGKGMNPIILPPAMGK